MPYAISILWCIADGHVTLLYSHRHTSLLKVCIAECILLQFYLGILIILLALAKLMNYSQHTCQGKYPLSHSNMESFRFLAVMLCWILSGTVGNCTLVDDSWLFKLYIKLLMTVGESHTYLTVYHVVVLCRFNSLTQTHPAAPYVCRTGNITLRCQYDGVENVFGVVWAIGNKAGTANPSTFPGHTALSRTTTYQEVVVENYTNVRERYHCATVLSNGTALNSNEYVPQTECKHNQNMFRHAHVLLISHLW